MAATASHVRDAAPKCSVSVTLQTRRTTARCVRPEAAFSPTAPSRACCARIGPARLKNSSRSKSGETLRNQSHLTFRTMARQMLHSQACESPDGTHSSERLTMLWTIFVILLVFWLLGLVSSYTLGGFIHILLVVALAVLLIQLI